MSVPNAHTEIIVYASDVSLKHEEVIFLWDTNELLALS